MKNLNGRMMCISAAALLMLLTLTTKAQRNIELGFRLMPSFNSFDVRGASGNTIKGTVTVGFGAAALIAVNLNDNVGIEGEVMYNVLSQKFKDNNVEHKINLSYINIPVLLSLNTGKKKKVNFNMVLGPQLGLNAGNSITTSGNNGTNTTTAVLSVKKSDFAVAYGAGFDFALNDARTFRLGIGYRGTTGLVDISDNSNTIITNSYYILDRSKIKTNAAYVGISYLFL